MANNPTMGSVIELHRGIEWRSGYQALAVSKVETPGYRAGLHSSKDLLQFSPPQQIYLDCRKENLRGGASELLWSIPKVVINAARKSRGPWRLAACTDQFGWVLSQQLVGCWTKHGASEPLGYIEALLNSPIASLYVSDMSPRKRFNLSTIKNIPIPKGANVKLVLDLVQELHRLSQTFELSTPGKIDRMEKILLNLDATLLSAYQLPAKLERKILVHFQNAKRPVASNFTGYPISDSGMARTLKECLEGRFDANKGHWVENVFQALPAIERDALVNFLP